MPLGQTATAGLTRVSTREELLKSPVTSGHGEPTHTPEVSSQTYYDVDVNTNMYVWRKQAWTVSITLI